MLWSDCSCSSLLNSESKWLKSPLMVAKDAMYRMTPAIVSLWSGDEGNEAQPKHSTRDKELIHSPIIIIFLFLFFFFLFAHGPPRSPAMAPSPFSSLPLPPSP